MNSTNDEAGTPINAADQERARLASDWIESDDFHIPAHATVTEGPAAAAEGRAVLEAALGGSEALERAISGGRPSLSGKKRSGPSPKRQVRLPIELDTALTNRARAEAKTPSELIRVAVAAYLHAS
jgi:hypothetical protein